MDMAWQKILDAVEEIERHLHGSVPAANPHTVDLIRFQCHLMQGHDSTITESAGRIARMAETYFSARKHTQHRYGASGVLADMQNQLRRIRAKAKYRAEQ